ncbi:MAG: hypothetical protein BEN19_01495 [Epulopiscium sp. Nuni2H_MBin003]|nr:MAG: hypothetical protein BEN19_01495 [Epulopiscium sp. Nuni2H_MBin003]
MQNTPRILIAGTNSGCGKTTITCALLSILKNASSFKCGPDYIDPMFHGKILGVPSSNLDPFFYDANTLKNLLAENAEGIAVIEGVMGFYDGMTIDDTAGSTYEVSKITNTPVILTINCRGMAYSVLPIIEGFLNHKKDYNLAGVILNNISSMTYPKIKNLIEQKLNIKVFGYLEKLPEDLILESRHLGLVTANEIENIKKKLVRLGEIARKTIDIEEIIKVANCVPALNYTKLEVKPICKDTRIAVAYDKAFCFYYKDNLNILKKLGATLTYFSPLEDVQMPEDADGLYLGGGYPELYLEQLSKNVSMKESILKFLEDKKPVIAECGGFMYLTKQIQDYKMVGYIDANCELTQKLVRFGYATFTAKHDNLLCKKGECFKGHEFHYSNSTNNGTSYTAIKPSKIEWEAIIADENLYAGYPHISFYSNIDIVRNFIYRCKEIDT